MALIDSFYKEALPFSLFVKKILFFIHLNDVLILLTFSLCSRGKVQVWCFLETSEPEEGEGGEVVCN